MVGSFDLSVSAVKRMLSNNSNTKVKQRRINSANLSINTVANTAVNNSGQSKLAPNSPVFPQNPSYQLHSPTANSSNTNMLGHVKVSPQRETFNSMPYKRGPVEILPGLYLGSERNAKDKNCLSQLNITAILNVGEECKNFYTTEMSETPSSSKSTLSPVYNPLNIISGSDVSIDFGSHFSQATVGIPHSADTSTGSQSSFPFAVKYKHLPWSHNQQDIQTHFDDAFAFIDETRNIHLDNCVDKRRPEGVLVHCKQGVSRSATLIIAYVMKATGKTMNEAYAMVKDKSPVISPNLVLIYQLNEYEKEMRK